MKNIINLSFVFLITLTVHLQAVNPLPTCYSIPDNEAKIYKVVFDTNTTFPTITTINIAQNFNGEGTAYRESTNKLYAFQGISDDVGPSDLYSIDLTTNAITLLQTALVPDSIEGAEFYLDTNTSDEILYIISKENQSQLYAFYSDSWIPLNGYPKAITGATQNLSSLAINPANGQGYAIDDYNYDSIKPSMYQLNLSTGVTSYIAQTSELIDAEGLAFASNGKLYVEDEVNFNGRKIYQIDLQTGLLTASSNLGGNGDIEGLSCNGTAFIPNTHDFGDAPNQYTHVSHLLSNNLYLGETPPDTEADQQSSVDATGDGADDNDSILNIPALNIGDSSYTISTKVYNNTGNTAYITAWIDFNRDGIFQYGEALNTNNLQIPSSITPQIVNVQWSNSFNNQLTNLTTGKTIMRIRLTTSRILRCDDPHYKNNSGYASNYFVSPDGEVEDYEINIINATSSLQGQFNIERTNSGIQTINSTERNAWYTQITGRDFDYSLVFYDENLSAEKLVDNITVKVDLLNETTGVTLYTRYAHIKNTPIISRVDIVSGINALADDLAHLPAVKQARFRVSYGVDGNNNIIQANCFTSPQICFNSFTQTAYSDAKDNFSIRPERFFIQLKDKNSEKINSDYPNSTLRVASGYDYNLSVIATQFNTHTGAEDYNRTFVESFEFNTTGMTSCANNSDINQSINFQNGTFNTSSFFHNNVGRYRLFVNQDQNWTAVDQIKGDCIVGNASTAINTTSLSGCNIAVQTHAINLEFYPYKFNIALNQKHLPRSTHPDFIYMSQLNKNHHETAIQFVGEILAQSEKNVTTTNFTKGCMAEDVLFTIDASLKSEDGFIVPPQQLLTASSDQNNSRESIKIVRMERFNNEDFNLTNYQDISYITESLAISTNRFLNEQNGTVALDIRYNIKKHLSKTINPIQITFNSFNLQSPNAYSKANQSSYHIPTGFKDLNSTVLNFYFAQIAPDLIFYPRINFSKVKSIQTPLNVDIFCNRPTSYCTQTNIFKNTILQSSVRKQQGWYLSTNHDKAVDGNVSSLTAIPNIVSTSSTPIEFTSGRNGMVSTTFNNCTTPRSKVIIGTNPTLKYYPKGNAPYYIVECSNNDDSEWTGIGKAGNLLDIQTNSKVRGRVEW